MIITITRKKKKRNYELRSTRMFLEHLLCAYACNRWLRNGKNIKSSSAIEMMNPLREKTCIEVSIHSMPESWHNNFSANKLVFYFPEKSRTHYRGIHSSS